MPAYFGFLMLASVVAIATIWSSWHRYWPAARTLKQQLAGCPTQHEMLFTLTTFEVERASAEIHRPLFTRERQAPRSLVALRAA